jgi:hypothetical protein
MRHLVARRTFETSRRAESPALKGVDPCRRCALFRDNPTEVAQTNARVLSTIATTLGVSRATVYRVLAEQVDNAD